VEEEDRKHTWMEDSEAVCFSALYVPCVFLHFSVVTSIAVFLSSAGYSVAELCGNLVM